MSTKQIACDHDAQTRRICHHLALAPDTPHLRLWTGASLEFALLCDTCSADPQSAHLISVCQACQQDVRAWACHGNIGSPQFAERKTTLAITHKNVSIPEFNRSIVAIQPVHLLTHSWIAITDNAELILLDLQAATAIRLSTLPSDLITLTEGMELRVSKDGRFIAVGESRGQRGFVYDALTRNWTMHLDRDDYCVEHRRFSLAFFSRDERTLLVHATAWNRLDISDPSSGELLTPRIFPATAAEMQSGHDTDYFHCRLIVSPNDELIAEDGWVWHPVGWPRIWSLKAWVENPWESDDGSTMKEIVGPVYLWDRALCWVDDRTIAIYGYGNDAEILIPAAMIHDTTTGELLRWFPGPLGDFYFDHYLYSVCAQNGTTTWDIQTGERLHCDPTFRPVGYHSLDKHFISIFPDGNFQLSVIVH